MSERLIKALDDVKTLPEITLGTIIEHIEEESLLILCLITILPFMQPIPIPGISSILGLIVLLQGMGLIFWGKPLLTQKMKRLKISHELFERISQAAIRISGFTSKLSVFKHPWISSRPSQIICGLSITLSAAFLSLPLPIPFSNLIPALSIFFICLGLLEDDILLTLFGHVIALAVVWMCIFSFHIIIERIQLWIW